MKQNLKTCILTWLLLCAAGIMTVQANTLITFSVNMATNLANGSFNPPPPAGTGTDVIDVEGAFNGWGNVPLVQEGSSTIWTNTVNDTNNANGTTMDYKYYINGLAPGETTACYDNRTCLLPTNSGASLVLPTVFYNDIGPGITISVKFQVDMSEQILLGNFNPTNGDTVVMAGSFDGWSTAPGAQFTLTNDPSILVTNNNFTPPLILSNVYTMTAPITQDSAYTGLPATNSSQDFKYVIMPEGNWESSSAADSNDNGNRWFTETGNLTLPLVSFSDQPYSIAHVTFNLDMSGVAKYDTNFIPGSVTAWGTFNGWASGVTMTNNLAAPNTNLYSATITAGEAVSYIVQFRYTNAFTGAWVYDYGQDGGPNTVNNNNYRHTFDFPVTAAPLFTNLNYYFNDLAPDDYLPQDTTVQFSVNMAGAVGNDGHGFVAGTDNVYINGMFAGATPSEPSPTAGTSQLWYPWAGGVTPVGAPPGYQMVEVGSSLIYTNTILMPAGTPVALSYQYGMDPGGINGGPLEDEAPTNSVHYRVVRSIGFNPYVMPTDTFNTNQPYVEPFFSTGNIGANGNLAGGDLTVGPVSAGKVPVSWLGRPGAHLQSATSLTGVWTDYPNTDGTNWTAGSSTTNGFMSVTNWPSSGNTFFRLVKP
jgi:hypothetical protein